MCCGSLFRAVKGEKSTADTWEWSVCFHVFQSSPRHPILRHDTKLHGTGDAMGDSVGPFIRDLAEARARHVADRVRKLVAAGVPYERLFLVSDPTCECAGLGIIV